MCACWARKHRASRSGQAAVETAIVTPLMVFFILGTIQLTLMHQASLMLEYAAFNAARSGAVWNMDRDRMNRAAVISLLPTMRPVRNFVDVGVGYLTAEVKSQVTEALLGVRLINVDVISPKKADFARKPEIEFDSGNRQKTQLTIRVVYFYELQIPFANVLLFESYWASLVAQNLRGADPSLGFIDKKKLRRSRWTFPDVSKSCKYNGINNDTMVLLRLAATGAHRYFQPLVTTYTIRMQSNPFVHDPADAKKQWAGRDDKEDGC